MNGSEPRLSVCSFVRVEGCVLALNEPPIVDLFFVLFPPFHCRSLPPSPSVSACVGVGLGQ